MAFGFGGIDRCIAVERVGRDHHRLVLEATAPRGAVAGALPMLDFVRRLPQLGCLAIESCCTGWLASG